MIRLLHQTAPRTILAAALAICCAGPLLGDTVDEKAVVAGKTTLDPLKGYIFVRAPTRVMGTFLRVPDDSTRAEYRKDWDKAFAKAQKDYRFKMHDWQFEATLAEKNGKKAPDKPPEPSPQTFTIPSIETRDAVTFGPMFAYGKAEGSTSYLTSVKPGTYIWYGPVMLAPQGGAAGSCYCMGTIRFEVQAGTVTNMGDYLYTAPRAAEALDVLTRDGLARVREKAGGEPGAVSPNITPPSFELPESLKAWPSVRARFLANGKLNNFYGVYVSRIPPIDGVIAYRRDMVIDAASGADVPNPPIVTQVKIKT